MSTSRSGSLRFWQVGGAQNLHFGHLHGTQVDLDVIARMPQLRHALMVESPELRIAVIRRGEVESLLGRDQVVAIIRGVPPPDEGTADQAPSL